MPQNSGIMRYMYCCLLVFIVALSIPTMIMTIDKVQGLQEVAGPITIQISPGETKSFTWGLIHEKNESNIVKLYADGNGSEFLFFPRSFNFVKEGVNYISGNVTVPSNFSNGTALNPIIHSTLLEPNETATDGGTNAVSLEVSKVVSIMVNRTKTENKSLAELQTGTIGFIADGTINSLITTAATKWIATGNWSMNVNNGNLSSFNANMTWYNSNGTGAHTHEFLNFKVAAGTLISLLQPGNTISVPGTMDVGTNNRGVWKSVPSTILINGKKTISISVNDNATNHHFASQPILGIVSSFVPCADIPGPNMEVLSPCTSPMSLPHNGTSPSSSPGQENAQQQSLNATPPLSTQATTNITQSGPELEHAVQSSITPSVQESESVSTSNASNFSTYENDTIGLKLVYPSNWFLKPGRVVNPSLEIAAILSPGADNDSAFTMAVQKLEEGQAISVGQYANVTLSSYKQRIASFQPDLFNPNGALSNKPAYEIDGTYLDDHSLKHVFIETGTIANNKVYIFQFDTPESKSSSYLPIVGEMLHSLQISSIGQNTLPGSVTNVERQNQNQNQNQTQSTCRNITVTGADASGFEKDPKDYNPPEHAIDSDLRTWWSNKGVPSWFQISLAEPAAICAIDIAWNKGDERTYDFTVSTSSEGQFFTEVFTGKSSGKTLSYENYNLQNSTTVSPSNVKIVKVSFTGSSSKVGWVGIRDVKVSGR